MKILIVSISTAFIITLLWLCVYVPIFGLRYETSRGEHTGYISATEKSGIFFKTGRAYLKTDTQSSQEDSYCVVNEDVLNRLKEASAKKEHVNVQFLSWFSAGVASCKGENAIIYAVNTVSE